MPFKKLSKRVSLEELADKEIKIGFPEGMRKGTIQETKDPSYPYQFNFTQMDINKTIYLKKTDIKISKKEIRYVPNYYALENHF